MRNLFRFLARNANFFLFLALEVICFIFIATKGEYQRGIAFNSTNVMIGAAYTRYNAAESYFHLQDYNDSLMTENTRLKNAMIRMAVNKVKDSVGKVDSAGKQYLFVAAKVLNNSINKRNNYLTLNVGYKQGVGKDMAVVCSNGVVGIVREVSENYCTVTSLLHKDSRISGQLATTHEFGSVLWEGTNQRYATLVDMPGSAKLHRGDRITTTAYSSIFPENTPIGTVIDFEQKGGTNFFTVRLLLSTNFSTLQYVYVVKNRGYKEQQTLEQKLPKDDRNAN